MATIQSEIDRIKQNVSNAFTSLSNKGATIPTSQTSDNLASTIDSLGDKATITYDGGTRTLTITTS